MLWTWTTVKIKKNYPVFQLAIPSSYTFLFLRGLSFS